MTIFTATEMIYCNILQTTTNLHGRNISSLHTAILHDAKFW